LYGVGCLGIWQFGWVGYLGLKWDLVEVKFYVLTAFMLGSGFVFVFGSFTTLFVNFGSNFYSRLLLFWNMPIIHENNNN